MMRESIIFEPETDERKIRRMTVDEATAILEMENAITHSDLSIGLKNKLQKVLNKRIAESGEANRYGSYSYMLKKANEQKVIA
jgi:hypothetical protein